LIALFSEIRLGEIIQMQVTDVKISDGIMYFDVTPLADIDAKDEESQELDAGEEKSLKTGSSRRGIPVHHTLLDIGFGDFLKFRRGSGTSRLMPEYEKAKDDGSWSKQFSKHFTRFRKSIGVTRRRVKFHSLRHNVEDALRNADVRQEVRDAIQGLLHGIIRAILSSRFVEVASRKSCQLFLHQPRKVTYRQSSVVEVVTWSVEGPVGIAVADIDKGAGTIIEHVRKALTDMGCRWLRGPVTHPYPLAARLTGRCRS
jgi:hypothetical protein